MNIKMFTYIRHGKYSMNGYSILYIRYFNTFMYRNIYL